MSDFPSPQADDYEYFVLRKGTHDELTEALNAAARSCWEPVQYAIWSWGSGMGADLEKGDHFVVLRRNTAYVEKRIIEEREALRNGEYAEDPDGREWAEGFLEEVKRDGYIAAE